jgi:hypothetical protein
MSVRPVEAQAGAATPTVCGFHFGTPEPQGALGSAVIVVPVVPNNQYQSCSVSFSTTASISGPTIRPSNIANNPVTSSVTVTFRPSQLPPYVSWEWTPHCADPSIVPLSFMVSGPGLNTASVPLAPETCSDFGTSTSYLDPPVVSSPNIASVVGITAGANDAGYRTVSLDDRIYGYGDDSTVLVSPDSDAPLSGIANANGTSGVWCVATDGGVFALNGAQFFGSMGGTRLNAPAVGIASTPDGRGYWLVASNGGIFNFGDASFFGSMGAKSLNAPIVGVAGTPDGRGYWLVAADGGVFSFGDAAFSGSMGGSPLNAPISGMAASSAGGYWLVGVDGGIFSFGGAPFVGSLGEHALSAPISGITATANGKGYWLVGADNGVFAFGDAPFLGSGVSALGLS